MTVICDDSVKMKKEVQSRADNVFPSLDVALDEKGTDETEVRDRVDKTMKLYCGMQTKFLGRNR